MDRPFVSSHLKQPKKAAFSLPGFCCILSGLNYHHTQPSLPFPRHMVSLTPPPTPGQRPILGIFFLKHCDWRTMRLTPPGSFKRWISGGGRKGWGVAGPPRDQVVGFFISIPVLRKAPKFFWNPKIHPQEVGPPDPLPPWWVGNPWGMGIFFLISWGLPPPGQKANQGLIRGLNGIEI